MGIRIIRKKAELASDRMRAALYYARKRRLNRLAGGGAPIPGGDEQTLSQGTSAFSTSNWSMKGNIFLVNNDRVLTKVSTDSSTGRILELVVFETDSSYIVTDVIQDGVDSTDTSVSEEITLTTPILLEVGKYYGIAMRSSDFSGVPMGYDLNPQSDANFTWERMVRNNLDASFDVGVNPTVSNEDSWVVNLTTEAVG